MSYKEIFKWSLNSQEDQRCIQCHYDSGFVVSSFPTRKLAWTLIQDPSPTMMWIADLTLIEDGPIK